MQEPLFLRQIRPTLEEMSIIACRHDSFGEQHPPRKSSKPLQPHTCQNCAARRVFGTPELLETILCSAHVDTVLAWREVNGAGRDVVSASPDLRPLLFLDPVWDRPATDFKLLQLNVEGVHIRRGTPARLGHNIEVEMTPTGADNLIRMPPRRPSRMPAHLATVPLRAFWQLNEHAMLNEYEHERRQNEDSALEATAALPPGGSLLLTQPPLRLMHAYMTIDGAIATPASITYEQEIMDLNSASDLDEDDGMEDLPAAYAKLSCDAGITLGFLAETTQKLFGREAYRRGRISPYTVMGTQAVLFQAIVSYCQSDTSSRKRSRSKNLVWNEVLA